MRKTNLNIKRVKFFKRFIVAFLIGQMIFLCLFIQVSYQAKPIDIQDCINARIVVEKKKPDENSPLAELDVVFLRTVSNTIFRIPVALESIR